jgi:glycosyltransferase involved in cell wall biosynthesis
MNSRPRLTIGLPVYNGENFLAESIEALLGQTFSDYELIIADNASTDQTAEICKRYETLDRRIRYVRHPHNIGAAPNHNFLVHEAKAELFKWASHDDLYDRELIAECVKALDAQPDVILAHSWTAIIDGTGTVTRAPQYQLRTASQSVAERFRSMLFDRGGDDDGGVIRTAVLRSTALNGSYYRADRTIVAELALRGRFYHVPDWLYFRRDHPARAERAFRTVHGWCANLEPRRASKIRNPAPRLYAEYVWAYVTAIRRSDLTRSEERACYRALGSWLTDRVSHRHREHADLTGQPEAAASPADGIVGRHWQAA